MEQITKRQYDRACDLIYCLYPVDSSIKIPIDSWTPEEYNWVMRVIYGKEKPMTTEQKYGIIDDNERDAILETREHPRVTKNSIEARIEDVAWVYPGNLTICIITMKNGFMQTGESAPADPRNFDADLGRKYAYENAFKQLWKLEGYLLCERSVL